MHIAVAAMTARLTWPNVEIIFSNPQYVEMDHHPPHSDMSDDHLMDEILGPYEVVTRLLACVILTLWTLNCFWGNINIYSHFQSFLDTESSQLVEIYSQYRGCWSLSSHCNDLYYFLRIFGVQREKCGFDWVVPNKRISGAFIFWIMPFCDEPKQIRWDEFLYCFKIWNIVRS